MADLNVSSIASPLSCIPVASLHDSVRSTLAHPKTVVSQLDCTSFITACDSMAFQHSSHAFLQAPIAHLPEHQRDRYGHDEHHP
jgi:hypothetical protein